MSRLEIGDFIQKVAKLEGQLAESSAALYVANQLAENRKRYLESWCAIGEKLQKAAMKHFSVAGLTESQMIEALDRRLTKAEAEAQENFALYQSHAKQKWAAQNKIDELRRALMAYVDWFGGAHERDCPADDTCECRGKAINDQMNAALKEEQPRRDPVCKETDVLTRAMVSEKVDLTRASSVTPEVVRQVEDLFTYHQWAEQQVTAGNRVRSALQDAYLAIIDNVPPCPTRTRALNMLVEARMLANSAITHRGAY